MKLKLSILLLSNLLIAPLKLQASNNNDIDKANTSHEYDLVNSLNTILKSQLHLSTKPGVDHISTFQKNKQIIIKVTHNPKLCYSNLVHKIARTASRINGVNFQDSFTLDIIDSYCKTDLFYTIQSKGLNKEVIIQYEDMKGNDVAQHKINKMLCYH